MSTLRVDSIRGQTADGTNRYVVQTKVGVQKLILFLKHQQFYVDVGLM